MELNTKDVVVNYNTTTMAKNFDKYSKYMNYKFRNFFEIEGNVFEVAKCLMLEMHTAALTLTNHILERLLKLALINKVVGIRPIPTDQWEAVFTKPSNDYGSILLGKSIQYCKDEQLINDSEFIQLDDLIRVQFRNGFAHADVSKIMKDIEPSIELFQFNLSEPSTQPIPFSMNRKMIPMLQGIDMKTFAKENAANYFDYVFNLIDKITVRLEKFDVEKHGDLSNIS